MTAQRDPINGTACMLVITAMVAAAFRVGPDYVKPDTDLYADLGGDDVDKLDVVIAIEEAFALEFSDDEIEHVTTVAGFGELVERKQRAAGIGIAMPASRQGEVAA